MKKYIIYIALCLAAALSCEQLPEDVQIYGVGCKEKEVALGSDAGECTLEVFADGEFTATLAEDATWIRFASDPEAREITLNGDVTVDFAYDINRGIPRTAVLTLTRGTNVFELAFNQEGILEGGVTIEQKNISIPAEGGQFGAKISTKLRAEDLSFEVAYNEKSSTDWIGSIGLKNNFISFDVKANVTDIIRHAVITVKYDGGKGYIQVSQYNAGSAMEEVDVTGLKALLDSEGEYLIESHIVLNGLVINDNLEKNGAENRLISVDNQDMTYADRIIYVQNEDGTDGIKLIFSKSCADLVSRYDRISLDTYGLTLKREDNPVRYSISRIPVESLVATSAGDAPAEKVRGLAELTDIDIYTQVTIPDVEIPVSKGSFAPVDIRYINLMVSYPMVIRDKDGGTSHMMVNVDCPWSRDGKGLPKGSGALTGVVVHEKCDNFEWDAAKEKELVAAGQNASYITGLGTIGDYQIRPVRKSEVKISEDASESFSTLMYEWGYCDYQGVNLVKNYTDDKELYPTYPLVADPLTLDAKFYCEKSGEKVTLNLVNDFTHVGPYEYGGVITEEDNGNGIYDFLGRSAHWRPYGAKNGVIYSKENKQEWETSNGSAWCVAGWSASQYWCAEFPTADLTEANSPLNITFGTMNHLKKENAIRNWKVQWSSDKEEWNDVASYTVPDFAVDANRKVSQLPGTKFITVNLPDETLGLEKVYVRLVPTDKNFTSSIYNAVNYFAIRHNN
ncbi:MAG: BACON domain-containing protein [Bacteroidales bacterium]|nr:BACON domain-containing protein [Bacteroidales bacterium]